MNKRNPQQRLDFLIEGNTLVCMEVMQYLLRRIFSKPIML